MGVSIWEGNKAQAVVEAGQQIVEELKFIGKRYNFADYKDIVAALRKGDGGLVPNGTQFTAPHTDYGNIDFVVRRKNVDKVVGDPDRPTITIQTKYLISPNAGTSAKALQYDRPEAFQSVAEAIPAGAVCKFYCNGQSSWVAGWYHFTATNDIAVGNKLCINGTYSTALTSLKVQVFADAKATSASAQYDILSDEGEATVNLGTWATDANHAQRVSYGSNNWAESGIRQLFNGSGLMSSIFTPKTKYDMMPTAFTSLNGFYGGFPADFRNCLGLCKVHNIANDVYESDDSDIARSTEYFTNDYFWLPSRKEIYGTNENAREDSESQFQYYAEIATSNHDKLMYAKGATSATTYWLRTPYAGGACGVRMCYAGDAGALGGSSAYYSFGVAPLAILA